MSSSAESKRFRFGAVDACVIIIVIGLLAAGIYRFTAQGMVMETNCTVVYTLQIDGVRPFTFAYYSEGLECYDKAKNEYIGTIKSVRYEQMVVNMNLLDGTFIETERPDIIRIFIEVEVPATQTESAVFLGGSHELKVGTQVNLNTKYIDVTATFISAEIIDKQ